VAVKATLPASRPQRVPSAGLWPRSCQLPEKENFDEKLMHFA
jgi:hypothetical protein